MTNEQCLKILDKIINKIRTGESLNETIAYIEGIKDTLEDDTSYDFVTRYKDFLTSPSPYDIRPAKEDLYKINPNINWSAPTIPTVPTCEIREFNSTQGSTSNSNIERKVTPKNP